MSERPGTRDRLERLLGTAAPTDRKIDSLYQLEREILGGEAPGDTEALSVKERLERLVAAAGKTRSGRLRATEASERHSPAVSLDDVVNGESIANQHGQLYHVAHVYPLDHSHGRIRLSRLKGVPPSAFSILAQGDEGLAVDLTRTVFLDTETTGLSGGSGTCAFLVGVGYVDEDRFVVRQFFMRDYTEEEAVLDELARLVFRFQSLVTFNGKSFDVPLLESRYVLQRLRFPLGELPHIDLLHPARSLWKARLESCRLTELEFALLGIEREDDVPSELIPSLYFDYVRSRDASRIYRVFSHNRVDILSLAALTVHASDMLEESSPPQYPLDDYSLARIFERASLHERSLAHYTRAVESGLGGGARRRSLQQMARQHKRRGELEGAMRLWTELADGESAEAVLALEELAMVAEHHRRDFSRALQHCQQALSRLEDNPTLPYAFRERWKEAFLYRARRLERRLGSKGPAAPPGRSEGP